jgi:hypothetical protein
MEAFFHAHLEVSQTFWPVVYGLILFKRKVWRIIVDGLVKSPRKRYASLRVCVVLHFVIIQRTIRTPHDYKIAPLKRLVDSMHALDLNFLQAV